MWYWGWDSKNHWSEVVEPRRKSWAPGLWLELQEMVRLMCREEWVWPSPVLRVTIYKRTAWDSSSSQGSGFTRMADCKAFLLCTLQRSSDALQKEVLGTLLGDICWDAGAWESYGSHQSLFVQLTTARDQSRVTNKSLHTWQISVKRSLWFAAYRESAKAVQRFHFSRSFNKPVLSVLRWLTFNFFTLWDLMRPQQVSEPSWITQHGWCLLQNCLSHMRKIHTRW